MSDRIDELVDAVNKMTFTMADTWFDGSDVDASARFAAKDAVMETVTELATIAREAEARALKAEAMCEWLAEEVAMGRHDTVDNVLNAAREAVTRDER